MAWLVKTEPGTYSYDDLEREGRAVWDGVANPQAQKNLKSMAVGERVFIYHTGDEKRVVGAAEVVRAAYPDPKQKNGGMVVVDLKAASRLAHPVTLADLKAEATFAESPLVRQGRLSAGAPDRGTGEADREAGRRVSDYVVAFSTVARAEDAERIAAALVEQRAAACVNIVTGLTSVYRWKGKIEREEERLLVMKTRRDRVETLRAALVALHPYEVPELIVLPIEGGHAPYLAWIDESLMP